MHYTNANHPKDSFNSKAFGTDNTPAMGALFSDSTPSGQIFSGSRANKAAPDAADGFLVASGIKSNYKTPVLESPRTGTTVQKYESQLPRYRN